MAGQTSVPRVDNMQNDDSYTNTFDKDLDDRQDGTNSYTVFTLLLQLAQQLA